MSAPLIWIALPLAVAVLLYFLSRRWLPALLLAGITCFALAGLALLFPIASAVKIGSLTIEIPSTFTVLGRSLILENGDRTFLTFIYAAAGFWLLGTRVAGTHRLFPAFGMAIVALFVAAVAVEPFLYAALIIETAVLISVPMLVPPGSTLGRGVLRYLIFQSLAMPFILLAGWVLGAIEANPSNLQLYPQAELFLALGFAFWLGVFPFYTWIPMLVEQVHPYVAAFMLTLLSTVVLLLTLAFLDSFAWLRDSPLLFDSLRLVGLLMVGTGGVWAAFQSNQARLVGYAVIIENGFSLLALSLGIPAGLGLFAQLFLPRTVGLAVWALALAIWQQQEGFTSFENINGLLRRRPLVAMSLLLAGFSLAGLPLLAGFPARLALLDVLAGQSPNAVLWALVGIAGFLLGCLRMLARMASGEGIDMIPMRSIIQGIMLGAGLLMLFAVGLFPDLFLPGFRDLLLPFVNLLR